MNVMRAFLAHHKTYLINSAYRPGLVGKTFPKATTASFHSSAPVRFIPGVGSDILPQPNEEEEDDKSKGSSKNEQSRAKEILFKALESASIMAATVCVIGLTGYGYQQYYHYHALKKMEDAFFPERMANSNKNAHPLALYSAQRSSKTIPGENETNFYEGDTNSNGGTDIPAPSEEYPGWVEREQQDVLDKIMSGQLSGRYYLLVGEKGTGKTSMILEAIRRSKGEYCTMVDAHPDPEIFRIRLGKALNFEFFEDYIGGMFSLRGPRDTTALLDIERAVNTLTIVATRIKEKTGRPLILVINNVHLIRDDEAGQHLVELLQQKAESLAGSVTMVFNSDDYWVYERLKKLGTRLDVITVKDMSRAQSVQTLQATRRRVFGKYLDPNEANAIYNLVGGRPQHLAAAAASEEPIKACHKIIDRERTWFLNQCGLLGEDMDDDVMESGKFSTSAMLLMRALVQMDRKRGKRFNKSPDSTLTTDHELPQIPLWIARRIMTRPDYIQVYDNLNIFTLDSNSYVRADSVPMMQAFHEIASMPNFDELLEETIDRVSAIESLGRTRELVAKDLVQKGGLYRFSEDEKKPRSWTMKLEQPEEDEDKEDDFDKLKLDEDERHWWWKRRERKFTKEAEKTEKNI